MKWSATKWMHVGEFTPESRVAARKAECRDFNEKCADWAAAGECTRNPAYMVGSDGSSGECLLSCGKCKPKL